MSYDRLSKYLSLILRHHPEVIGISLDAHGWADVDELIIGIGQKKKFSREILEEIVRTDKKQRYSFNEDGTKIRANQDQSHSAFFSITFHPTLSFLKNSGAYHSLREYGMLLCILLLKLRFYNLQNVCWTGFCTDTAGDAFAAHR